MSHDFVWVPGEGFVAMAVATAEQLRASDDARWVIDRPLETTKRVSVAKRPQVRRGIDLRELEEMIAGDEWIGTNQRHVLLREVRLLAQFYESRTGAKTGASDV
jgi:hypothetical protein